MTSTIGRVIHHWLVSVTWDLRVVQCCCADSSLLGCEVTSLGKWLSVFSRQYSPLKHWNHLPSDIAFYPKRPELMSQTVWWFCEETNGLTISYCFLQLL